MTAIRFLTEDELRAIKSNDRLAILPMIDKLNRQILHANPTERKRHQLKQRAMDAAIGAVQMYYNHSESQELQDRSQPASILVDTLHLDAVGELVRALDDRQYRPADACYAVSPHRKIPLVNTKHVFAQVWRLDPSIKLDTWISYCLNSRHDHKEQVNTGEYIASALSSPVDMGASRWRATKLEQQQTQRVEVNATKIELQTQRVAEKGDIDDAAWTLLQAAEFLCHTDDARQAMLYQLPIDQVSEIFFLLGKALSRSESSPYLLPNSDFFCAAPPVEVPPRLRGRGGAQSLEEHDLFLTPPASTTQALSRRTPCDVGASSVTPREGVRKSRGMCSMCRLPVLLEQRRKRCSNNSYVHLQCLGLDEGLDDSDLTAVGGDSATADDVADVTGMNLIYINHTRLVDGSP